VGNDGSRQIGEIEVELVIKEGIVRVRRAAHKQRIAVLGRAHGRLGGYIGAGAWPVFDDEWLTEPLRTATVRSGAL
jgi:hypothetical protein